MRNLLMALGLMALGAVFVMGSTERADAQGMREGPAYERTYPARAYRQRDLPRRSYSQRYRWCAYYGPRIGASNCYFVTLQQCMAAVSGVGGFCSPSPYVD